MWYKLFGKWMTVRDTGIYLYQQNSKSGKRRILRYKFGGYQPIDRKWLEE